MKELDIFPHPMNAARSMIDLLILTMQKDPEKDFNIALSGGSSVSVLYEVWQQEYAHKTDWNRLFIYWVDERCVSPFSNESNFKSAYDILLNKVDIGANHYYRILGEAPPQETVRMYRALVKSRIPHNSDNQIVFDFVFLGIGLDGHTSSIFPNSMDLLKVNEPYEIMHSPDNNILRIGMTGNPMINALHSCFFVWGKEKKKIVDEIIQKSNQDLYPASYVWNNAINPLMYASF